MDTNVVRPTTDDPPGYTEQPPAGQSSAVPYGQSTLLHGDAQPPKPTLAAKPVDNGPPSNYYPPPAGHPQFPVSPPGQWAYGQPMPPGYGHQGYGTPYYGAPPAPQQQQQQQQQVVIVSRQPQYQPVINRQIESFVGQMILACFVLWCCSCLFGLIAFILAIVASNTAVSNPSTARQLGHASYGVSVAGIVVSVLTVIIIGAVFLA